MSLSKIVLAAGLLATSHALADGHTLHNARLSVTFGSSANGYTTADADRVDAITWLNSAGTPVTNWVTSGGPLHCGDPQEYFGESYGDTSDSGVPVPLFVIAGVTSAWSGSSAAHGKTAIKSRATCDTTLDGLTHSTYAVTGKATLVNTLKVERSFKFAKGAAAGNLRAYVPRLPLQTYPNILAPNAAGIIQTYQAINCPVNCTITDWNGTWMADDDGHGNGMVVIRNPGTNPPAQLTLDYDGYSNSNNSAITLTMPGNGFKGAVTETEYLCFYDAASWPAKDQAKGKLPKGCSAIPQ